MMKLEEFAEINMGQSPVSSSYNENEDGLPFFQGKADFGKINPKAKVWCNKPTKIAEKDDILMSVRAPVGDLNIATAKCCIGRGLAGIRAKKDKCYFKYLFYFLRSKYNELNQMSTGSTFKAISKNNILNIEGNIPEIKEQKIIVSKLDKFQDLIIKTEEQIELLDDLIKSQFVEMFGDIKSNDKNWKTKNGSELFIFSSGKSNKTSNLSSNFEYKCYGGNGITGLSKDYLIDYDTIVIGRVGAYCGSVHTTEGKVWITDNAIYIKEFKEDYNIKFLKELFEVIDFHRFANFSGQPKITQQPLQNYSYILPPIELQNQFADIVKQIDKQKFEIQNELIELKKVKEYLMNKYFN